jgi:ABC-type lipoprotein release transport system permease subunit
LTVLLILTIAVGVGSNASVHGFIRGLITRDMPALASDRVFTLFAREEAGDVAALSADDLNWLKEHARGFAWLGASRELQSTIEVAGSEDVVSTVAVTPPVARLLGLSLDDGIAISHELWQTTFGSRATVRGDRVRIDGRDTRVASVAPEWLEGLFLGRNVDVWTPLADESLQSVDRSSRTLWVFGQLRPGVSTNDALTETRARWPKSGEITMLRYTGVTPELANGLTRVHALLALAAGAVFLIVCTNVASFLLARASARSRETSVRIALGASRRQLVGQLLADSAIIAVAGGSFGVLLAIWTSQIVPALLFESDAGHLVFVPDLLSIAVASAVCGAVTIACGLTPLLEVRHDRPAVVLRRESMGPSTAMGRLRAGLVVSEMTACCMLVISTGLLLQGFRSAVETSAGRRFSRSVLATVQSESEPRALEYFKDVEVAAQPATRGAATGWVARPPGSRPTWRSFRVVPAHAPLRDATIDVAAFTPETLERLTLPPVAGRLFAGRDGPGSCRVAVVNAVAADSLFGGDAIGQVVIDPEAKRVEIIGVVAPRTTQSAGRARPTIYYYPLQTETPNKRTGPARFQLTAVTTLAPAILNSNVVSPGYFAGTGATRVAGEALSRRPGPDGCRAAVINREAAEQYFGGDAVGGAIIDPRGGRTEIIGVVSSPTLGRFQHGAEPSIYFPMQQDVVPRMTLVVDPRDDEAATLDTLRSRVEGVPGRRGEAQVERLDQHLARTSLAPLHIAALLVRASAGMAIVLAIVGVYGALTDAAQRRRREIGIRIALGAQAWRVMAMVVREGGRLAALGAGAGMLGAVAVRAMLVRIAPAPLSGALQAWLAGPALLLAVVVVASVVPAFRAVMVDPVTILKDET